MCLNVPEELAHCRESGRRQARLEHDLGVAQVLGVVHMGRILDFLDKGNDNRRACSLYLSLMDRMGVRLDSFGDSRERLAEI